MTNPTPVEPGAPPRSLIDEAMVLYENATGAFALALREAQGEDPKKLKEVSEYARELTRVLQVVLTERAKVDGLRRKEEGIVHEFALDLDAARDEIGRRLACLRGAGAGG